MEGSEKGGLEDWSKMERGKNGEGEVYELCVEGWEKENLGGSEGDKVKEVGIVLEKVKGGKRK